MFMFRENADAMGRDARRAVARSFILIVLFFCVIYSVVATIVVV